MATTVNGYTVIFDDRTDGPLPRLRKYEVPGVSERWFYLRDGIHGFILMHVILWHHETVEKLNFNLAWDEWGWAVRPVRGQREGYSNHAGAVAADINSLLHPRGVPVTKTMTDAQIRLIRNRVSFYDGVVIWGGGWNVPDGMHYELADIPSRERRALAEKLMASDRGIRIMKANPGLKKVMLQELSK